MFDAMGTASSSRGSGRRDRPGAVLARRAGRSWIRVSRKEHRDDAEVVPALGHCDRSPQWRGWPSAYQVHRRRAATRGGRFEVVGW